MGVFLKSKLYESLNVGVVLDEGLANPENAYTVFYGERQVLSVLTNQFLASLLCATHLQVYMLLLAAAVVGPHARHRPHWAW